MAGLNKVQIIGNLGRDPEVRTFQNGGKICNLRIATSESWKDKSTGERKERVEWHSIAIHAEHAVRYAEQYLKKGSKVYVEGKLETRKWQDQSGKDCYSTEIVVRPYGGELQGLDKPGENQGGGGGAGSGGSQSSGGGSYGGGGSPNSGPDIDDEIPFAPEWRL